MAVIDTSVYVSSIDPNSSNYLAAQAWLLAALGRGEHISSPWILATELGAAFGRTKGNPSLALQVVRMLIGAGLVELVPVGPSLAHQAAVIAAQQGIKGCDAIFVALAVSLGETLVTLDKDQATRAAAIVPVYQPT